jgi:hypothetical protein
LITHCFGIAARELGFHSRFAEHFLDPAPLGGSSGLPRKKQIPIKSRRNPMINAVIRIPLLHCTQQYDENGNSEPYLWFAYFWADATSISAPDPISVFVPSAADTRAQYPDNIGNNRDIPIPIEVGRFEVNLEGGGSNLTMLGVLAVLFEEDDTHSDAIAAGYDAFRIAVSRELNKYVKEKRLTPSNDDDVQKIVSAIYTSVYNAIAAQGRLVGRILGQSGRLYWIFLCAFPRAARTSHAHRTRVGPGTSRRGCFQNSY